MVDACCSEPEAAALLALATQFKPHVWMNVHSGMEALFMPYDHLASIPKGETAQATLEVRSSGGLLPSLLLKPCRATGVWKLIPSSLLQRSHSEGCNVSYERVLYG